jgi:hypothetical protein
MSASTPSKSAGERQARRPISRPSAAMVITAYPGKVDTGFPKRICGNAKGD